jgi:hypothetical protein
MDHKMSFTKVGPTSLQRCFVIVNQTPQGINSSLLSRMTLSYSSLTLNQRHETSVLRELLPLG